MPLTYSMVHIPIAGGLAQQIDPRVVPDGHLLDAKNARWTAAGAVGKRKGFAPLAATGGALPSGIRALGSTGDELVAVGPRRLYGYVPALSAWLDRGPVSPLAATSRSIFSEAYSFTGGELAISLSGAYWIHVATRVDQQSYVLTDREYAMVARVDDAAGRNVVPPVALAVSAVGATRPHSPRCCATTDKLVLVYARGNVTPAILRRYDWTETTATTIPVFVDDITADLYVAGDDQRTHDCCELTGGYYLTGYVEDSSRDVILDRWDWTHVTAGTRTINANSPYYRVATHYGEDGDIYVAAASSTLGTYTLEIWRIVNNVPWTTVWGPVIVATGLNVIDTIGVAQSGAYVVATWTTPGAAATEMNWHSKMGLAATGLFWATSDCFNAGLLTQPFWQAGRCYVGGCSVTKAAAFDHHTFWDVTDDERVAGGGNGPPAVPVMLHEVGTGLAAPVGVGPLRYGNGHRVIRRSTTELRTMAPSLGYALDVSQRTARAEVSLLFAPAPSVEPVMDRAVIIGGGLCSWYAGSRVEELGYATAPMIYTATAVVHVWGVLAAGTYSYQAVWEAYDDRGFLHRSMPSPAVAVVVGGGGTNAVEIVCRTTGHSHRFTSEGHRATNCVLYRAGADAVFRRVTEAMRLVPNINSAAYTAIFLDWGQTQGAALYTDGGAELEAAPPEGALYARTIAGAVWLAGFVRRDRIQPSKRVTPGTAAETATAPEYHESLAMVIPDGERATGLAEMDEKAVVFTTSRIYVVAGQPPGKTGASSLSPLTAVATDGGCIEPRSVASCPAGVFFEGAQGIMLLDRGHAVTYAGEAVREILATYPVITSAVVVPAATQVRWTATSLDGTSGAIIVYDYAVQTWAYWLIRAAGVPAVPFVAAALHQGAYYAVTAAGIVWYEDATSYYDDGSLYVPLDVTTAWLAQPTPGAWRRVRRIIPTAERKDRHRLIVSVGHDYKTDWTENFGFSGAVIDAWPGAPTEQPRITIARQKCQAIRVRIFDDADASVTGEGYTLAGLAIELGAKGGTAKVGHAQRS